MIGRICILDVTPAVGCGRWPAKAVAGESVPVGATVFRDGHGAVGANVVLRDPSGRRGCSAPMRPGPTGSDRMLGEITPDQAGGWAFWVEAWADPIASWRHDASIKVPAGQDVELMLEEGARLSERARRGVPREDRPLLTELAAGLRDHGRPAADRLADALREPVIDLLGRHPLRELVTRGPTLALQVDRPRALFGSWYEFFPRSEGALAAPPRSGTLATAAARLPAIAAMGFDVVYLPPIHPIGTTLRKGPNNTLRAGPTDPGVPWAIGSPAGGHDAVHPDLGTLADFDDFVARAADCDLEVALDLALQCSPDHPWVTEHPEWFAHRADGSIAYAENPPKRYQDIYPLDFDGDPAGLYAEVARIVRHWIGHGVRIFRVDNPHTKPVQFWEWLLAEIRGTDPDVLFLAEAFTRPPMMRLLAQVGFHQSYTYFTWRNEKAELESYLTELATETVDYLRPNLFVNTPDILHAYLQYGGPPAFKIRAVVAALASPTWGVYSGYELCEHVAVAPGSEEYLDSEKYQLRPRDWAAAEREGRSLAPFLAGLNRLRRTHPALQRLRNLRFHHVDSPHIVAFSKRLGDDVVLAVVNLDPHGVREATVSLNMPELGLGWADTAVVRDEITGAEYVWGQHNYVRLDPFEEPVHVLTLQTPPGPDS